MAFRACSDSLRQLSRDNYIWLTEDPLYYNAYLSSLIIAGVSTILTLMVGYPIAYGMARAPATMRPTLLMLVILPFWTSFLIRVYAWIGILKPEGLLNQLLLALDVIDKPLNILNTNTAIFIGIVYSYLPFMVLPIYSALEKMDYSLIEAAQDLGCTPIRAFWKITFPLSLPGVIAGCLLVFIPAVGEFVIPDLLGGSQTLMIGKTLWNEFFSNRDWPVSSAVAVILLLLLVVPIVLFQRAQARAQERGDSDGQMVAASTSPRSCSASPSSICRSFSWSSSRSTNPSWSPSGAASRPNGMSRCSHNQALIDAAWVTVRVGLISATVATVLGTLAALAMTRYTRFRGRMLFSGMIYAPLVMPEVITGLSMLLLFVAIGLDRGFWTVTLAHITFTMCFVAVVVQSRLVTFDRSLEEAAMDLGATPVATFFR